MNKILKVLAVTGLLVAASTAVAGPKIDFNIGIFAHDGYITLGHRSHRHRDYCRYNCGYRYDPYYRDIMNERRRRIFMEREFYPDGTVCRYVTDPYNRDAVIWRCFR